MQLEEIVVGDVAVLRVTGDITLRKSGDTRLNEVVRAVAGRGHTRVLLDLAGVSYVDSAGLGELLKSHGTMKNHGGSLGIFNVTRRLLELMTMTRLTTLLTTYESEADAFARLGIAQPN